jgi:DNA-binding SARP family transcriptional activator
MRSVARNVHVARSIERNAVKSIASRARDVVWITAPAGSGKSTFARQICERDRRPVVWLRAEPRLAETGSFLTALTAAFAVGLPDAQLPPLASEDTAFPVDYLRRLIAGGTGARGLILVLDDLHTLPVDAPPLLALAEALRSHPDGFSIILISRVSPHASWKRLEVSGDVVHVDFGALRLTDEEADELLLRAQDSPNGWTGEMLAAACDGWILGARLLLQAPPSPAARRSAQRASNDEGGLIELIAQELLVPLPPERRALLLRAAALPTLPVSIVAEALGEPTAKGDLADLAYGLLFIEFDDGDRLQIHDLLKDTLDRCFPDDLPQGEIAAIRERAGRALIERGQVAEGLLLLSSFGAWSALGKAVEACAPDLAEQGELGVILAVLDPMPEAIRNTSLALRYWHGVGLLSVNPIRARLLLTEVLAAAREAGERELLIPIWTGLVDAIWLEWIDCSRFDPLIAMLPELEPLAARQGPKMESMLARGAFAAMSFRCPHHPDYPRWEEKNLDFYWQPMPRHETIRRGIHLMFRYCFGEGNRWKVTQVRARLNQVFAEDAAPIADICTRYVVTAEYLAIFEAAGDEVFRAIDEGLEANAKHGQTFWDGTLINAGLFKAMTLEDRERGGRYLALLAARLGPHAHPHHVAFHEHFTAYLHWLGGNAQAALTHLMPAYRTGERSGMALFPVHYGNAVAGVLQSLGRRREAAAWLRRARRAAAIQNSPLLVFLTGLRGAALAIHSRRPERAAPYLRLALGAGAAMRLHLHSWIRRSEMAELVRFAVAADIEKDYATELMRALRLAGDLPAAVTGMAPARIVTLGRFDLLVNDASRLTSAKQQRGPIALAVHLVAAGPRGLPSEVLADRLWPEADEATARKRLKSTVYRLRQLIGKPEAVLTGGGKVAFDASLVAIDAWNLESLADAPGWTNEARYGEAMRLYAGSFVHHHADDAELIAYGQRLESTAAAICGEFADELARAREWGRALRIAKGALERLGYHERLFEIAEEMARQLGREPEIESLREHLLG